MLLERFSMNESMPTMFEFSNEICTLIFSRISINLFLCVSKGWLASALFKFVCAVANAVAKLSKVS